MKFVKFTDAEETTPVLINLDKVRCICRDDEDNYTVVWFQGNNTFIAISESMTEVSKRIQEAQNDRR